MAAYVEPFVILLILIINAVVGVVQERNAEGALEALKQLQAIECKVLRNGKWTVMDSVQLVPGDIVEVNTGDRVPADLRILKLTSISLLVEEAPLTGESVSVEKTTKTMGKEASLLQEQRNMLFSSTVINSGSAVGIVCFIGMKTAIGRVQEEVMKAKEEEEPTPLKKKLDEFGETLSKLIGIICLLVWLMNFQNFDDAIHGTWVKGCIYYFKIAIALAVAAIPEGLPAVITTCLALGTRKMAKNNAIVRRLPSVETLGCTTVICSDKTGTLTKNQMCATQIVFLGGSVSDPKTCKVEEKSYSTQGWVQGIDENVYKANRALRDIAVVCTLNNKSSIVYNENEFQRMGEPTEAALKVVAEKIAQFDPLSKGANYQKAPTPFGDALSKTSKKVGVLEFSSERKMMSTIIQDASLFGNNNNVVLLKGAPERVIEACATYKLENGS